MFHPRKHCLFFVAMLLVILCTAVTPIVAQEVTAAITGTVVDPSGAAIANAHITATDTQRGVTWPATTNASGVYNLPRIPVGSYTLKVEAAGFQTATVPAFTLVLNQTGRIDVAMKVGQTSETVEVTGAAPVLQTETTEVGTVIDSRANLALPLASRNYNQLTLLTPGAVSTNSQAFTGPQQTFQSGRPYINGNREQANHYILDGMDNRELTNDDVAYAPSVEAIQEFNVISQNAPADFGNYLGGIISVSTKSGTNSLHGDLFEFFRNDVLNANEWSNNLQGLPKNKLRWNEFGGSVGGAIIKDKLFFFADYQGSRFSQPATQNSYSVLTTAERSGDFSAITTQLTNPVTNTPYVNNQIPLTDFNPSVLKLLQSGLYATPVNGNLYNNAVNVSHSSTNSDQGDLKIDWAPNQKDHISGRYSQQSVNNPTTNSDVLIGNSLNTYPLYSGVADWTRSIGISLVNDARFGVQYFPVFQGYSNPTGENLAQAFGISAPGPFLPQMDINGTYLNTVGGNGLGNNNLTNSFVSTVIQAEDSLTWTEGKHTWHFGFQTFRDRANVFYPGNEGLAGQMFFGVTGKPFSGSGESDFVLGYPDQIGLGAGSGSRGMRNSTYAAFAQDNWRVNEHLTLNLGLRWELNTPRYETNNQETNYGLYTGQVMLAGQNGASDALYNQYNGIANFQPRIGFAWSPGFARNTVIRAAWSVSEFSETTGTGNLLFQNAPYVIPHNVTYSAPTTTIDEGFSSFPAAGCTPQLALASSPLCFDNATIHAFEPNVRPAVSQQWNVSIQKQLGASTTVQLGYVGQKNTHLMDIYLGKQGVLQANGTVDPSPFLAGNPTLMSEIGQMRVTASDAYSTYNALQAVVQKRLSNGLQFQGNYTWSKCLTNSSGFFAQYGDQNAGKTQAGNDYFFFQNTYDQAADYGRCPNDLASAFNGYVTYDLPFGHGRTFGANMNPVLNGIVGGWQVSSILNLHTGFAITPQAVDASGTVSGFARADCVAGVSSSGSGQMVYDKTGAPLGLEQINPAAAVQPSAGTFGNCAVGAFRGPGQKTMDLSLSKIFSITERQNVEFKAEAINFTNTPILSAPNDNVSSAYFGLITGSQGARNIQFALKYHF